MAFNENSKIKDILMNEQACAVVEKYLPGFSKHPLIHKFKNYTIKEIASFPQVRMKKELFEKILEELYRIG